MLLYIVRHGDPIYVTDSLTEKGKLQALALAKRLCIHGLNKICSSPLGRAIETAQPTCEMLGLPLHIEEWTREVDDRFSLVMPDGSKEFAFNVKNTSYRQDDVINLGNDWHSAKIFDSIDAKKEFDKI